MNNESQGDCLMNESMGKKLLCFMLIVLTSISMTACSSKDQESLPVSQTNSDGQLLGNIWLASGKAAFQTGTTEGIVVTDKGLIELKKDKNGYLKDGTYISTVQKTLPFKEMMLTCNIDSPEGTSVKMDGQIMVDGKWSKWISWGTWCPSLKKGSSDMETEDELAVIDTDILSVKGEGKTSTAVRYRLTLSTEDSSKTPSVRLVAVSIRNKDNSIPVVYTEENIDYSNFEKDLEVPAFSQYKRQPSISDSICSPTSVSMVLNYHGVDILPEECAWGAFDNVGFMFGNWVFNSIFPSTYGFTSYAAFLNSIDDLKREISKGFPVVCSVRYRRKPSTSASTSSNDLPVISNAPILQTTGHLVTVCGFTHEDGKEYVIVNDPAGAKDDEVRLKYLADEFEKAWVGVSYIIHKENKTDLKTNRIKAKLEPTGNEKDSGGKHYREYKLKVDKETIDISSGIVTSIIMQKDEGGCEFLNTPGSDTIWLKDEMKNEKCNIIFITRNCKSYVANYK